MLGQEAHESQAADALAAAALAHDAEGGAAPQRIADIVDHRAATEGDGEVLYFKYDITVFHASITGVWGKKYVGGPLFFQSDIQDFETSRRQDVETTRVRVFGFVRLDDVLIVFLVLIEIRVLNGSFLFQSFEI